MMERHVILPMYAIKFKIIAMGMTLVMLASIFAACEKKDNSEQETQTNSSDKVIEVNKSIADTQDGSTSALANADQSSSISNTSDLKNIIITQITTTTKNNIGTTTKDPTTTKKHTTTTQLQSQYLSYVEVKECVAEAKAYATKKGFVIDSEKTIYGQNHNGVHYGVNYGPGADTCMIDNKATFIKYLKDDINWRYNELLDQFGYFPEGASINIYIAGPKDHKNLNMVTTNYDGTPRYIAYVCV